MLFGLPRRVGVDAAAFVSSIVVSAIITSLLLCHQTVTEDRCLLRAFRVEGRLLFPSRLRTVGNFSRSSV
jgi:hypothetical protein